MSYPQIGIKRGTIDPENEIDFFSKPLEFRSLKELSDHLIHEPFSYYELPDEESWDCLNIYSYKTIDQIRQFIKTHIDTGAFKLMEVPKIFRADGHVCATIKEKNDSQSDTTKKINQATIFFFKMYNDIDVLFAIRKSKKYAKNLIMISMDQRDKLKYYKYTFIFAHLLSIKF